MTIFELFNKLEINKEFQKIENELRNIKVYEYNYYNLSAYDYLDKSGIFKEWEYRDTIFTIAEYLEFIGVYKDGQAKSRVELSEFLLYLEFLVNILAKMFVKIKIKSRKNLMPILRNISIILDKLGYFSHEIEPKKYIVSKKDEDIDSVIDGTSIEVSKLLIKYNDYRIRENVKSKQDILKQLANHVEENKQKYQQIDNSTYKIIEKICNNFEINHPLKTNKRLKEEVKESIGDEELLLIFNDCYKLIIHLIRAMQKKELEIKYNKMF